MLQKSLAILGILALGSLASAQERGRVSRLADNVYEWRPTVGPSVVVLTRLCLARPLALDEAILIEREPRKLIFSGIAPVQTCDVDRIVRGDNRFGFVSPGAEMAEAIEKFQKDKEDRQRQQQLLELQKRDLALREREATARNSAAGGQTAPDDAAWTIRYLEQSLDKWIQRSAEQEVTIESLKKEIEALRDRTRELADENSKQQKLLTETTDTMKQARQTIGEQRKLINQLRAKAAGK